MASRAGEQELGLALACYFRAQDIARLKLDVGQSLPLHFSPWVDDAWPQIPLEELQSLRMAMADVFLALGHVAKTLEFYDHAKDKMPRSANVHFRYFAALE